MAKNSRPEIDNPLANMGLDDIVRGITTPGKDKEPVVDANGDPAAESYAEVISCYPVELIRLNAHRNIPLRSLAAAIIMTYIEENEESLNEL